MKKLLLLALALCAAVGCAWAAYPQGYYDAMEGKSRDKLKAAAKACVQSHTQLIYQQLPVYWQYTDVYADLYNGSKRWWDMYSDNIYLIRGGESALGSFSRNRMQREHSVPKSWWKSSGSVDYTPAYSDLWNLYPSDGPANQAKLNYAFGECASTTFDNGVSKIGPAKTGMGGGSGNVFEPDDRYKGDFARAIFYMATVYDDLPWAINYMFQSNSYPTLRTWAVDMLLQWSRMDPVDEKEKVRNDAVQNAQGNRNPFIDFPELAEYIWGTRTTETFHIADQGGQVTPPFTGDPEVTSPENGDELAFGDVALGKTLSAQLTVAGSNLTSNLSVRITGTDRTMFTVSANTIPALQLNQGESFLLNIVYRPTSEGEHHANLTLYDGGLPLGQQINVSLSGKAFPVPELETLTATDATNLSDYSYTANWNATLQVIDNYVVTRVRYDGDDTESEELNSDTNSLDIYGRTPDVTESYYVRSSRLGYLSEPSNVIVIPGGAGVVGIHGDQPLTIGAAEGGFVVLLDTVHTNLRVYNMSGTLVLHRASVCGGETFSLPAGVYVVTTDQALRPCKTTVF